MGDRPLTHDPYCMCYDEDAPACQVHEPLGTIVDLRSGDRGVSTTVLLTPLGQDIIAALQEGDPWCSAEADAIYQRAVDSLRHAHYVVSRWLPQPCPSLARHKRLRLPYV